MKAPKGVLSHSEAHKMDTSSEVVQYVCMPGDLGHFKQCMILLTGRSSQGTLSQGQGLP